MLHELLLSLSGHPSPLLKSGTQLSGGLHSVLSPAEIALLGSLADDLGEKHKTIRDNATNISASHSSTACRAVASAIISVHLAAFQRRILEVEEDVLKEDTNLVGAYNIVPLSAVVGSFDGWGRRLEWLRELVQFMQAPFPSAATMTVDGQRACTAAKLIGRLRESMNTGYPDIEEISLSLIQVAEMAWLKQVSAWVLYGRHPEEKDFFITSGNAGENDSSPWEVYKITESLLPPFVTSNAAHSILFVGRSLNHIRERQTLDSETLSTTSPELALLPAHLAQLSALKSPMTSASFSAAIGAIRLSLSQNALQKLLPMSQVLDFLYILKDFFLLERGEFAVALITAADDRLNSRSRREIQSRKTAPSLEDNLASLTIKEGEVQAVLARTWTKIASSQGGEDDEDVDEELDRARELIRLSIKSIDSSSVQSRDLNKEKATAFDDLLLPSSTALSIEVPSPLDLFLTVDDTDVYSRIHAYLIAIRRAHLRLSQLFLLSKLRREHPCPRAPSYLTHKERTGALERKRQLSNQRTKALRPAWATIGSASFFFTELGEYFQGEVIQRSWMAFHSWLTPTITNGPKSSSNYSASSSTSTPIRPGSSSNRLGSRPTSSRTAHNPTPNSPHDPETLAQAHKHYLTALEHSLLLEDATFTRPLRRLMTAVDHITALMQRLNTIQTNLDIETDAAGSLDPSATFSTSHYPAEEQQIMTDLRGSLPRLGNGVYELVEVLRNIDNTRVSSGGGGGRASMVASPIAETSMNDPEMFTPWSSRSLDRLLLKFDYKNEDDIQLS